MDSQTFIRELKLFLKENKKNFIYSILLCLILGSVLQVGVSMLGSNNNEMNNEITSVTPAAFEVYIENPQTGEPYTNSYILEEFFEKDEWMSWAEERSGVELSDVINEFQEEHPEITNGDLLKPISSNRDKSSHIFTVRFNFGNGEENLAIAQAYYDLLTSEELTFMQNKEIYTISLPILTEESSSAVLPVSENGSDSFSIRNIIIVLATSLVGGTLIGFVIAFARSIFSNKINYGFSYSWNEEDIYIGFSNEDSHRVVSQTILQPASNSKVILNETLDDGFENQIKEEIKKTTMTINSQLYFEKDVLSINPSLQVDEFIIIIHRKETTKKWYNKQRELLKNYPLSLVKIVQI